MCVPKFESLTDAARPTKQKSSQMEGVRGGGGGGGERERDKVQINSEMRYIFLVR